MKTKSMNEMTSAEIHAAIDAGMKEVHRQIAAGEMDMSGRFYTDEELAAGAATEGYATPLPVSKATAA